MNTKMILTDLDHTLLRSDGSISEYTKQILKKCQNCGVLVAIATARYWIGAERYIEELRSDYEFDCPAGIFYEEHIFSERWFQNGGIPDGFRMWVPIIKR